MYSKSIPSVHLSDTCLHLSDSAVSICDASFAWERNAEPLLKKYVCFVKNNIRHVAITPNIAFISSVFYMYSVCVC